MGVANALRLMKEGGADVVKMQGGKDKSHIIPRDRGRGRAGDEPRRHVPAFRAPVRRLQAAGTHRSRGDEDRRGRHRDRGSRRRRLRDRSGAGAGGEGGRRRGRHLHVRHRRREREHGQLLLAFDLLGVFDQFKPKFTKRYAQISDVAVSALKKYASEVREGKFPDDEHSYSMKPEEQQELARLVAARRRA
jgi:3-methyl-2-oxobutanoate hydroxymethyltransferase